MEKELNCFINQFNNFENAVVRYIHKKYKVGKEKNITLKDFRKEIFGIKRPRIIYQDDITKRELEMIHKANIAYCEAKRQFNSNEIDKLNAKTEYGYPDSLRCNFIINHKNNFIRCKNKIDEHSDCCLKHCKTENFYYEKYLIICRNLISRTATTTTSV
jgi:hypothetical protein